MDFAALADVDWGAILDNVLRGLIGEQFIYFALAAIGLNLHFGYTGLLNFGQAAFMAAGAYGLAIIVTTLSPRINDDGWIVFRGRNAAGDEAAFVSDGVDILEIASVGTGLHADFAPAVVGGVVGGVDINNAGQAVINAELRQPPLSSGRGLAIVRVDIVPQDDCPAAVNGDGELTPADFNAWVIAFNGQLPPCDQNGDGLCTPSDFSTWVQNFNAGC